jgi:hypothetical protein
VRRALATLLLALAIVSPLAAQSAATPGPTTRYSRLSHEGHPSTAVHRTVGKKLFEEIAARAPVAR